MAEPADHEAVTAALKDIQAEASSVAEDESGSEG
jgi:hypothetical protein